MTKKKILLVALYSELQPANSEPFAIEVLASALKKEFAKIEVRLELVNPNVIGSDLTRLLLHIQANNYDIIGLSIPQGTLTLSFKILDNLNVTFLNSYKPLIVLGHALPTYEPEVFLNKYPHVVCVHGWGEDALIALVSGNLPINKVPGIYYLNSGKVSSTSIKWAYPPQSARRNENLSFFPRIETSRGCSYNMCTFCLRPIRGLQAKGIEPWRRLELDQVINSIKELKKRNISEFTFTDEDFLGKDPDFILEIAQRIKEIGGLKFSISALVDDFYDEDVSGIENEKRISVLKSLHDAGLSLIFCGVESLSQSQLKRYGKKASVSEIVKSVEIIRNLGIPSELGFILFDPFMTKNELLENISTLEQTGIWEEIAFILSFMRVHKQTPYELWLKKLGLLGNFDPNMLTYEWKFKDDFIGRVAQACISWKNEFHQVYKALRNVERSNLRSNYAHRFLLEFRCLDLQFLKYSTLESDSGNTREKENDLRIKRGDKAKQLLNLLGGISSKAESILLEELNEYLHLK